jgi:hypothetical protein
VALYFGKTKETSRLGTLLVNKGAISDEQLEQALTYQQGKDLKLGEALIELGLIELKQLDKALCRQRWSRSLVASVMMIATPVCPVLASENSDDTQFNASSTVSITSDNYFQHNQTNEPKDKFLLGLAHKVSFSSGIEIGLGQANEMNNARFNRTAENNYIPQITLFTSTNQIVNQSYLGSGEKSLNRFDRSKNTSPAVYRLTLKGYALFEQDDKTVETFGFKRIDTPYKSFELMFSVTKQF